MANNLYRIYDKQLGKYNYNVSLSPTGFIHYNGSTFAVINPDDFVVERNTGVNDVTGQPIYENDYLMDKKGNVFVVKWNKESAWFECQGVENKLIGFDFSDMPAVWLSGNANEGVKQNAFWCDENHSSMIG